MYLTSRNKHVRPISEDANLTHKLNQY